MPTRRIVQTLSTLTVFWLVASASAAPNPNKPAETTEAILARATTAEKANEWEKALELYLKAYLGGRQTSEVRDRISTCYRHAAQVRRHRDPLFQQHVVALPSAEALNLYAEVLEKLSTVHADRDRATPAKLFLSGVEEFDRALANRTFRKDYLPEAGDATVAKFRRTLQDFWRTRPPKTVREARAAVLELTRAAQTELGLKSTSAIVLELLCGSCNSLDEYTVYLSPTQLPSDAFGTAELATYGLVVAIRDGQLLIERILPDSWAAQNTTLRVGDRINRINGRTLTTAIGLSEALRLPLDGSHELELAVGEMMMTAPVRLPTPLPTIRQTSMLNMKDGIGYIKLAAFGDTTLLELDAAILRLKDQGLRSLILDLRGNTGGHFLTGVRVAERFLPSGIIATTDAQIPEFADRIFSSESGMMALDVPIVVMIDTKTMSAAEVVASALKEHNRATLVGMPSFGKGVVQFPFKLSAADGPDAAGVHKMRSGTLVLTIAKVLTASGTPIHKQGVLPDIIESDAARQMTLAIERATAAVTGMR